MPTTLDPTTLDDLDAIIGDDTAPETLRHRLAELVPALRLARDTARDMTAQKKAAVAQLDHARNGAAGELVAQLTAKKPRPVPLEIVATLDHLNAHREQCIEAERIADRAVGILRHEATVAAFTAEAAPVLSWVARRRVAAEWHSPAPRHVAYAWAAVGRRYGIIYGPEVWLDLPAEKRPDESRPSDLDIDIDPYGPAPRIERWWFAWSAIAAGEVIRRTTGTRVALIPVSDWSARRRLAPLSPIPGVTTGRPRASIITAR